MINFESGDEIKGILKIPSVKSDDSGVYECAASNGLSVIKSNFTITIRGMNF